MAADGAIRFGFAQSEVYEQEMVAAFDRLAAMPYLAVERQTSHGSVRVMPCGSHNILYIVENEDVIIPVSCMGCKTGSISSNAPFAPTAKPPISWLLPGA